MVASGHKDVIWEVAHAVAFEKVCKEPKNSNLKEKYLGECGEQNL